MEDEDFTDRMVELLYGELEESEEADMRAHLDSSEASREAYSRLTEGHQLSAMLEMEEPPPGLLDGVLAAARDVAAERVPATEPVEPEVRRVASPREPREEETGPWGAFLQWLGGFAARPQFAMAMMLMLMIGIGLWYVPDFRGDDPMDSQAILDPAPGDEVGPSASLQPAEPLDLEADPATGRMLPRDDEGPSPVRRAAQPTEVAEEQEEEVLAENEPEPTPEPETETAPDMVAMSDDDTEQGEGGEVIDAPLDDPRVAQAQMALAPGQESGGGQMLADEAAPPPVAPTAPSIASSAESVREEALPSLQPRQPTRGSAGSATERYQQGMQRYRARQFRQAAEDFESVVERPGSDARQLLPSALHHQARSERAIGNCRAATRSYERLLGRYASYSGAPEAMIEAADCYRRLGQLSAARRWLERAQTQPSVAARARQQLQALAARERAGERGPDPAAAESEAD